MMTEAREGTKVCVECQRPAFLGTAGPLMDGKDGPVHVQCMIEASPQIGRGKG